MNTQITPTIVAHRLAAMSNTMSNTTSSTHAHSTECGTPIRIEPPPRPDVHDADRRRASERPIVGAYQDFALEVRRLLGWEPGSPLPFLSTRAAYQKTGVSNGSVNAMSKGIRPSPRTIEAFAAGLGADAAHLKRLAGHVSPEEARRVAWSRNPAPQSLSDAGLDGIGEEQHLPEELDVESHGLVATLYAEGTRAVWVKGSSLQPLYRDGDLVFVLPAASADLDSLLNREVVYRPEDGVLPAIGIMRSGGIETVDGESVMGARIVGVIEGYMRFAPTHPEPISLQPHAEEVSQLS